MIVNNVTSSPLNVISGVPQGSVLGPLLFLIYINDIASSLSSTVRLYADDLVLYRKISSINDCIILQDDLEKLTTWCESWLMTINLDKSKIMSFSRSKNKLTYTCSISSCELERVATFKYLGVFLSADLSWKCHVDYIWSKANRNLEFLRRHLYLADPYVNV